MALDDISFDSIFQNRHVEIDERSKATSREAYISQDDGLVNGCKGFDGFEFDYNPRFNQQVDSISAFKLYVFVDYRYRLLPFHLQVPQF